MSGWPSTGASAHHAAMAMLTATIHQRPVRNQAAPANAGMPYCHSSGGRKKPFVFGIRVCERVLIENRVSGITPFLNNGSALSERTRPDSTYRLD